MTPTRGQPHQLSLWPSVWSEGSRCAPNLLLRAALFAALGDAPRRFLDRVELATNANSKLIYTGVQLDQGDLDVWLNMLHIARLQPMGNQVRFTAYRMLKLLGRADTGGNRRTLHKRILRLKATAIELQSGHITYMGSLIQYGCKDDINREYMIVIDPALHPLFDQHQFTYLDKAIRHELEGKPLAQWLHAFYSTHGAPYPLSATYLRQLSGSTNACPKSFRQKLKRALADVELACQVRGRHFQAEWRGEMIQVTCDRIRDLEPSPEAVQIPSQGIPQLVHSTVTEDTEYRQTGYRIPSQRILYPQEKQASNPHECLIPVAPKNASNPF